ncbi:MAG: UDP-N-acetylmuramoyl-tripeptide--D-alanyl-D-alanine ligase [Pseudomonadota bacterium]
MNPRWGEISPGELITPISGELISGSRDVILKGLCTDSRQLEKGQLFWALKGENFDGHDFIEKAAERGAACVVAEMRPGLAFPSAGKMTVIAVKDTLKALGDLAGWWRHQYGIPVAAVTGSTGKTTTKEMAAHILEVKARTLKNRGNFNNLIGLPLTLLSLEAGHRRAVLEMGMNRFGEIGRLTEIADPDVGLITNVARAHLEGLGDIEGVARAKTEIIGKMSAEGLVVLNGDDALLMKTASAFRKKCTTFGLGAGNDIKAQKIRDLGPEGFLFELQWQGGVIPVKLNVPGFQNIYNAMAASAIALGLGEAPEDLIEGLKRFRGIKGRFMLTRLKNNILLVDDTYNSNPYSLKAAINSLRTLAINGRRVIVGLGEMMELGHETSSAHREAGEMVAGLGASHFVALGEHAGDMVKGAVEKGLPPGRTAIAQTHEEMAGTLMGVLEKGDVIFLKGSRMAGLDNVAERLIEESSEEG